MTETSRQHHRRKLKQIRNHLKQASEDLMAIGLAFYQICQPTIEAALSEAEAIGADEQATALLTEAAWAQTPVGYRETLDTINDMIEFLEQGESFVDKFETLI